MARIETRMPDAEGVAPGQTATFKLPIGRRFHRLAMQYSGVTLAQMPEIRVLLNGKVVQRYSAEERDKMNQGDKLAAAAGILVLPFDRNKLKTRDGEEMTSINTGSFDDQGRGINSFHIEVDIAAAATAPALKLWATQSEALPGGAGTVMHINKRPYTVSGAGEFQISDMVKGGVTSMAINRVYFKPSANVITRLEIERDTRTIFERDAATNERLLAEAGTRSVISGWFTVDKTEAGYGGDPINLVGVNDFRYIGVADGAMTVDVITEYLGGLGD